MRDHYARSDTPRYSLSVPRRAQATSHRLLAAFGNNGSATGAAELQQYAGIAPVTERVGKKRGALAITVPAFIRQTFVEWAGETIPRSSGPATTGAA